MEMGIDAVGEAVSGGLLARAAEPEAGEHHGAGEACLNCGAALAGEFCHDCGQKAHVHRTLSAFGHDLLHGVLHFEGKIWRTLPMLAWHPGRLTRRYVAGERANFVSPLALFLFSVFLMFAVINATGGPFNVGSSKHATPAEDRAEAQQEYREEMAEAQADLRELNAELQKAKAAGENTTVIELGIQGVRQKMRRETEALERQTKLANEAAARQRNPTGGEANGEKAPVAREKDEGPVSVDFTDAPGPLRWFKEGYRKAMENPSLLFYKLQSNAYKFSWALIPISLPFVWLLFLHRRRYRQEYKAYDHVVFITYSIAFMSLAFVILTLLRPLPIGQAIAGFAITFGPPIHMYRQLRGAYQLSRFSAVWRTLALLFFALVASMIFLTLLLAMGLMH